MKTKLMLAGLVLGVALAALAETPPVRHVVLVVEENHSFESIISQGGMPYLKSLAEQNCLLTNYYANHHPSIGNYFVMSTGQTISTDDGYGGSFSGENIVSQLVAANKTWKLYADSLPQQGYIGGSKGAYAKKHAPIAYFDFVRNSDAQRRNMVPSTQFLTDLASPAGLPNFSMVIPNLDHDAHDGTLQQADDWLKINIGPLLANREFLKDGILIITFDESFKGKDNAHGGGHVTTVVIGAGVKKQSTDDNFYQHESLFTTLEDLFGLPRLPLVQNVPSFKNVFDWGS